jgi:hypothetical protein
LAADQVWGADPDWKADPVQAVSRVDPAAVPVYPDAALDLGAQAVESPAAGVAAEADADVAAD